MDDFTHIKFFRHGDGPVMGAIPLDDLPEMASRIGIFLAFFAVIELSTRDILRKMLGISQEQAQALLGPVASYSAKLDILEQVSITLRPVQRERFGHIICEMRWANGERNRYAHSQYAVNETTQELHRIEYFTELRRPTKWTPLSKDKLDADIQRMRVITAAIWQSVTDWTPSNEKPPQASS